MDSRNILGGIGGKRGKLMAGLIMKVEERVKNDSYFYL